MTQTYHNFISSVLEENYAEANKYLQQLVEAKLKGKIKRAKKACAMKSK